MAASTRAAKLATQARTLGWRLEGGAAGFRLVDDNTGTIIAAVWSTPDGFGLTLDEVEAIITAA